MFAANERAVAVCSVHHSRWLLDPRCYPVYVSILSVVLLALQFLWSSKPVRAIRAKLTSYKPIVEDEAEVEETSRWKRYIVRAGGGEIMTFKIRTGTF